MEKVAAWEAKSHSATHNTLFLTEPKIPLFHTEATNDTQEFYSLSLNIHMNIRWKPEVPN